jgi:hypothetical protein
MTRTTLIIAAIAAAFFIASFVSVLVVHSIILFMRLALIAALALVVASISRVFSSRAGQRQGLSK